MKSVCFDDFISAYRIPAHAEYEPEHGADAHIAVVYYADHHESDHRNEDAQSQVSETILNRVEYDCFKALYQESAQQCQQDYQRDHA